MVVLKACVNDTEAQKNMVLSRSGDPHDSNASDCPFASVWKEIKSYCKQVACVKEIWI